MGNQSRLSGHRQKFQQKSGVVSIEFFFPLKRCPVRSWRPLSNHLIWTRTETPRIKNQSPLHRRLFSVEGKSAPMWMGGRCTQPLSLKPSVTPHPSSGGAQTFTSLRNSTHVALSARTPLSNFVNLEIHPPIWRGNVPRKLGGLKVNGLVVGFKNNVWYGATSQHFV